MPKKGEIARQSLYDLITKTFSDKGDYICTKDKKIYVQAKDGPGGEVLQFAISMTMPKVPVETRNKQTTETAWDGSFKESQGNNAIPTELSSEDRQQVERLKNMLKEKGVYQE